MLHTDTKRRIDTARDILLGKEPDPESQVERKRYGLPLNLEYRGGWKTDGGACK